MPGIRRGEAGDLTAIAAIQDAAPEAAQWTVAEYLQYDLRVAICENRVAGFMVARATADREWELLNLAVAPEFRHRGVATTLVKSLLDEGRADLFLEVRESNHAAHKFYESMGFHDVGRRPSYYESPAEAAIVMKFHSC